MNKNKTAIKTKTFYKDNRLLDLDLSKVSKLDFISVGARNQFNKWFLTNSTARCNATIVAYDKNKSIGFVRYVILPPRRNNKVDSIPRYVILKGTYVDKKYRNKKIGRMLWEKMLSIERPKKVWVSTVSKQGYILVSSMAEKYKNIKFKVKNLV
jgi:GNAT superfamily N-acetyltransferase